MNRTATEQKDELSVCDKCDRQFWFSQGTIVYFGSMPKFLCPVCYRKEDAE